MIIQRDTLGRGTRFVVFKCCRYCDGVLNNAGSIAQNPGRYQNFFRATLFGIDRSI